MRDITHRPGEMRETRLDVAIKERWGEGLVWVPEGEHVVVDARLESVHEGILVTADADAPTVGECGRCLTPINQSVDVHFQELFAYSGLEEQDAEVRDEHVDLEVFVRDAIVLALPFQPVCRADCPGLDPETGEKLADGESRTTEPIDPRWAALEGLSAKAQDPQDIPEDTRG